MAKGDRLIELMAKYSEEYYAAGWLMDVEFQLWEDLTRCGQDESLGKYPGYFSEILEELGKEAAKEGGWAYWDKDAMSPRFVTFREWKEILGPSRASELPERFKVVQAGKERITLRRAKEKIKAWNLSPNMEDHLYEAATEIYNGGPQELRGDNGYFDELVLELFMAAEGVVKRQLNRRGGK